MTSKRPDLYAILEVSPHATQAEIGHAYRALLRRHHPDTHAPVDESHSGVCDALSDSWQSLGQLPEILERRPQVPAPTVDYGAVERVVLVVRIAQ